MLDYLLLEKYFSPIYPLESILLQNAGENSNKSFQFF